MNRSIVVCPLLLLLHPFPIDSLVILHQLHCRYSLPSQHTSSIMSQPQPPHNKLRHRLRTTKVKRKDDDDVTNDVSDIGKSPQSHNGNSVGGEGASHHQNHHQTRKNSHSNIEHNLIVKRTKQLQQENNQLKKTIQDLQSDHRKLLLQLHKQQPPVPQTTMRKAPKVAVPVERFEGDRLLSSNPQAPTKNNSQINKIGDDIEYGSSNSRNVDVDADEMWCDVPNTEDGTCPMEPDIAFTDALRDRAVWLVSLLVLQSISGIILYKNELVLANHPSIIYFLTMLVGAGGNAGNQASVRVIRGIAVGALAPNNHQAQRQFLFRELKMALGLSIIVAIVGFLRTILFHSITPLSEAIAITIALYMIVFTSICFGAMLPFILQRLRIDPAHSSTSIQVIMDILGVYLTVAVTSLLLDSPLGKVLISNFT